MAGYTPVFDSVYAGTLCGRWPTTAVWVTLLPLCDKHGHIDLSHSAICALTGWPLELLQQGIAELMKPDPDSRSAAEEGRRLVLLDPGNRSWGWRVVNHSLYREKARKLQYDVQRTASGRDAERKRVSREVPTPPAKSREVPLSDSDSDSDSDSEKNTTASATPREAPPPEFKKFKLTYPARAGSPEWGRALKAIRARLKEGHTWDELTDGANRYMDYVIAVGKLNTEFVKQAATFCGPEKHFLEAWSPPATKADNRFAANVSAAHEFLARTNPK